jgi:twitching motility two-component system response regulator PilH
MIFKDQGAEVIEAPDANQGIRAIKSENPDLVTLDLILPKMTGEKLYWEIKKDERFARLPIVVVSGCIGVDAPRIDFHRFIAEKHLPEPEAILEKPINPEKVLETVRTVLENRKDRH